MKQTLNTYQIADLLKQDEYANWSYAGALALAEYLEELEEDTGEEIELDVIVIRCDFSEYESFQSFLTDYYGQPISIALKLAGIDFDNDEDEDEIDDMIRDFILDHGQLIEFEGGIIVSSF